MKRLLAAVALLTVLLASIIKASDKDVPVAVDLGTIGPAGFSTSRPPTIAVSDSGIRYVFWERPAQRNAPKPERLPRIPEEFSFAPAGDPEFISVPAVSVYRKGRWSRPGLLVDGLKECCPIFSWCEEEKVNLLVAGPREEKCHHLQYDPKAKQWKRLAGPPLTPSQHDAIRSVGKTIHLACVEGRYVYYLQFDGTAWSKPLRIDASENRTSGVTRARLAVDRKGTAHIAWWCAVTERGVHGYAVVRGGKVESGRLQFETSPVYRDEFDIGIDPQGRVLLAYKADLPQRNRDALMVHVRRRNGKDWMEPEKIGGDGEILFGSVEVAWTDRQTMVSWLAREETKQGRGIMVHSVRRLSITDGKSWSQPRFLALSGGALFRFGRTPAGPISLSVCVDKQGDVHTVWGSPEALYCLAARLGSKDSK
jgi:hypothetical protein